MTKEKIKIIELARRAGLGYQRVHVLVWEGKIPASKDDRGRWQIDQAVAEAFIKSRLARMGERAGNG